MILTLTGASGTGKTTIAQHVLQQVPKSRLVMSCTTRRPRARDLPGEYAFITTDEFMRLKRNEAFAWTASLGEIHYGTTFDALYDALQQQRSVINLLILVPERVPNVLDIATQYGRQHDVLPFFIRTPPENVLRERMMMRGDGKLEVAVRLRVCESWESMARSSRVPYIFIEDNGDLGRKIDDILRHVL